MIMPLAQIIMADAAGPKRMGRVMGLVAVPMMLAPTLGPLLGGTIIQTLDWHWIFFVNLGRGAIAVPLAIRLLPAKAGAKTDTLDFVGLALMSTGLVAITYGLAEAGTYESFSNRPRLGAGPARRGPGGRLRVPRAARQEPAAGPAPLPQLALLGRLDRDVRAGRRGVRSDDPDAAVLAGAARLRRDRDRPADRSAGARHGDRDAAGRRS